MNPPLLQRGFWRELAGACVIALVAAVPIMMSSVMQRGFEIAKLALIQPLAPLAAGVIIIVCGRTWLIQRPPVVKLALAALATFAMVAAIATATAADPELALFGSYDRREGLLAWMCYCAFFVAVLAASQRGDGADSIIDVMLIASVIPAAYALQQRAGLDFFPLGNRDASRADGTLGSPVFMAAYAAMVVPVAIARALEFRRAAARCLLWSLVATMAIAGLFATQTRGPLLALAGGTVLLVLCAAAQTGAKRAFFSALAIFASAVLLTVAINAVAPAKRWAETVPVLSRLVIEFDWSADGQSQRATRSALSRAVIWQGGLDTFSAATAPRKLIGYGPDSVAAELFPHVPAAVVRLVGYGEEHAFDRLHADSFDHLLMFGLAGWAAYLLFFLTVMYGASTALLRPQSDPRLSSYMLCALGGGVLGAGALYGAGYAAGCVPAFGIGCGVGIFVYICAGAWRSLRKPATEEPDAIARTMLAGLMAALWVYWMDAQINVPVPTTRLMAFALAALILASATSVNRLQAEKDCVAGFSRRVFGLVCMLIATLGSCMPNVLYAGAQDLHWALRTVPFAVGVFFGALAVWSLAGIRGSHVRRTLACAGLALVVYVFLHAALIARPATLIEAATAFHISLASAATVWFVAMIAIAFAWGTCSRCSDEPVANLSVIERIAVAGMVLIALGIASFDWQQRRAEISFTLAAPIALTQPQLSERLLEDAIERRSFEPYYHRQLARARLSYALGGLAQLERTPPTVPEFGARLQFVLAKLRQADSTARAGALLFPRDPWVIGTLANVLQIEALRALRPLDPAGSIARAKEADELFQRAHRIFPVEPLILRNWAQFLAEQGELNRAYRVFDRMEALTPADPLPYIARIVAARGAADEMTVAATLVRARQNLQNSALGEVLTVADAQQRR